MAREWSKKAHEDSSRHRYNTQLSIRKLHSKNIEENKRKSKRFKEPSKTHTEKNKKKISNFLYSKTQEGSHELEAVIGEWSTIEHQETVYSTETEKKSGNDHSNLKKTPKKAPTFNQNIRSWDLSEDKKIDIEFSDEDDSELKVQFKKRKVTK
ncbi:hypothetical protein WICMUC_005218 [Wickerhamomyces mucosus]|uniref:Uncharacterized protein n=1 Tax=Wickerhamomyces mucosus TaxID=1378264 RepID=A0A9P8T682_9ASCO|nr:hypothetical protein WICMUC_005218 [Wickerhamomyces mucosus]